MQDEAFEKVEIGYRPHFERLDVSIGACEQSSIAVSRQQVTWRSSDSRQTCTSIDFPLDGFQLFFPQPSRILNFPLANYQ